MKKIKGKIILLLALVSFTGSLTAQQIDSVRLQWLRQIADYRDSILLKNPLDFEQVNVLLSRWEELKRNDEELEEFIGMIYLLSKVNSLRSEKTLSTVKTIMYDSELSKELTIEDINVIDRNIALIELRQLGVLEKDYPFKINAESDFLIELLQYGVTAGERIGEIGAGRGSFSLMLYKLQPNIALFVNELDENDLAVLQDRIANEKEFDFEDMEPILGDIESTNMEGYELDKVIIRNAFHHFTEKEKMLASIKKSLRTGGHLYLLEGTKELAKKNDRCNHAMREKQIVRIIEENGYELLEEVEIGQDVLLKFRIF